MTQPPPQYGGPPQGPTGTLVLNLQGSNLTSSMITPTVRVNGHQVRAQYGPNPYVLPPGPAHLDVHCRWLVQFGQAGIDAVVHPGRSVEVFYAAPWHQFSKGSIGFEEQSREGLGLFVGLLVVLSLVAALAVAGAVLG